MQTEHSSDTPWHTLNPQAALDKLSSSAQKGLSESEALERLERFGRNELPQDPPRPAWKKFLDQFKGFLIIVLLLAAVIAWAIGDVKDAVVILVVVFLNSALGFYQEHRAEQTLAALKGMLSSKARTRRDNQTREIDAALLVPGDVVLLEAGDQAPADGRLLQAKSLEVAEAALTGESAPVGKDLTALEQANLPLAERDNMLFMNTVVVKGRAEILVTATGKQTEMGKIAGMIAQTEEEKTPLQAQLDTLGQRLAAIAGVVVVGIFGLNYLRDVPLAEAAMSAVALAVAAVPEGLPAVVTVTLAIGMWRMANNKAILKKLSSVETLGSTTVICSDKTGTLTMNKMSFQEGEFLGRAFCAEDDAKFSADEVKEFLLPLVLCSEASRHHEEFIGDPTEIALLELAMKAGIEPEEARQSSPRLAEIPFDSTHKFMATFHHRGNEVVMLIKGAPDVLLRHCQNELRPNGATQDLTAERIGRWEKRNLELAAKGLRVLAVASKSIPSEDFDAGGDLWLHVGGWSFIGMAGIMDPPRPEAMEAIALCHQAGIQVKMITGDHKATASTIAKQLGIKGEVVQGKDIDAMSKEELVEKCDSYGVFARVSPENKVNIVKALKSKGHIAAMTGDGVNDAPALKSADIGIAMGITGTAVTKEAANMILTDDNFATIVKAVKEGRVIYDNIVKFVRFQLSTNIGAILAVLVAVLAGLPAPFTPIQLLWINIIMDGPPAMSLGMEAAREGLMSDAPRRPGSQILTLRRLWRLVFYGAIMAAGSLSLFVYGLKTDGQEYAATLAFTSFVFFQVFNVFNAREERDSAFNANFFKNNRLWLSLVAVIALQVGAINWAPAREIFAVEPLSLQDWALVIGVASSLLILEEIRKLIARLIYRS